MGCGEICRGVSGRRRDHSQLLTAQADYFERAERRVYSANPPYVRGVHGGTKVPPYVRQVQAALSSAPRSPRRWHPRDGSEELAMGTIADLEPTRRRDPQIEPQPY